MTVQVVNVDWGGVLPDQATPEALGAGGPEIGFVGPGYEATGADPNATYTLVFDDSHTFAQPGTYPFSVGLYAGSDGIFTSMASASGTATVAPNAGQGGGGDVPYGPDTGMSSSDQTAIAGQSNEFLSLASYVIPDAIADRTATGVTIDWGDGTPATAGFAGKVGADDIGDTLFAIDGQHTYAQPGTYTFTTTFTSNGVALASTSAQLTVTAPVQPPPPGGPVGVPDPVVTWPIEIGVTSQAPTLGRSTSTASGIPDGPQLMPPPVVVHPAVIADRATTAAPVMVVQSRPNSSPPVVIVAPPSAPNGTLTASTYVVDPQWLWAGLFSGQASASQTSASAPSNPTSSTLLDWDPGLLDPWDRFI